MKKILSLILVGLGVNQPEAYANKSKNLYDFKLLDIDLKERDLSEFKGQVIMIVNVASRCGFTKQYEGLERVYKKYKDQGFVVLGFPSNDFGAQEPGSEAEIKEFCQLNFGVSFPMFKKVVVKGKNKVPLFAFLTTEANSLYSGEVMWNFEKFLIDKKGRLVERYRSITKPDAKSVEDKIEQLLAAP